MQLSEEMRQKVRKEVKRGTSRYNVAEEMGICPRTVYKLTADLPKRKLKRLTEKTKREIRKKVKQGVPRPEVAKELGVAHPTVVEVTGDMPKQTGHTGIRGLTLKILQTLLRDGYSIPPTGLSSTTARYRSLSKYIPLKRVQIRGLVMYFLEGREKEAFQAFMNRGRNKVISYHKLDSIMSLFNLSKKEKRAIKVGKLPVENNLIKKIKSKKRGLQTTLSDFIGRFLPSEVLKFGVCPHREFRALCRCLCVSNPGHSLRKAISYPLDYEGI